MNIKRFTTEELAELRENPYTYKATPAQLRFTAEFKERFWNEYNNGALPREIIVNCGYDPEALGSSRINGILLHVREAATKGDGFRSESKPRSKKETVSKDTDLTPEGKIQKLEKELAYLRKEVEFLKKISSVKTFGKPVKS